MDMHATSDILCWLSEYFQITDAVVTFFSDGDSAPN